jgi:hypothetical protein
MKKDDIPCQKNIEFVFSKKVTDLDLFKHDSIKKLFNYVNNKDVELTKVKILIKKANRELCNGNSNIRLFIRKAYNLGEENKKRICVTTK